MCEPGECRGKGTCQRERDVQNSQGLGRMKLSARDQRLHKISKGGFEPFFAKLCKRGGNRWRFLAGLGKARYNEELNEHVWR